MGELPSGIEEYMTDPEQEGSEQEKIDQYASDAQKIIHKSPEWEEAKKFLTASSIEDLGQESQKSPEKPTSIREICDIKLGEYYNIEGKLYEVIYPDGSNYLTIQGNIGQSFIGSGTSYAWKEAINSIPEEAARVSLNKILAENDFYGLCHAALGYGRDKYLNGEERDKLANWQQFVFGKKDEQLNHNFFSLVSNNAFQAYDSPEVFYFSGREIAEKMNITFDGLFEKTFELLKEKFGIEGMFENKEALGLLREGKSNINQGGVTNGPGDSETGKKPYETCIWSEQTRELLEEKGLVPSTPESRKEEWPPIDDNLWPDIYTWFRFYALNKIVEEGIITDQLKNSWRKLHMHDFAGFSDPKMPTMGDIEKFSKYYIPYDEISPGGTYTDQDVDRMVAGLTYLDGDIDGKEVHFELPLSEALIIEDRAGACQIPGIEGPKVIFKVLDSEKS